MNNSKFRAIPDTKHFEIPFKLEEKALLDWLRQLTHYESQQACSQTLQLIRALNQSQLNSSKRYLFLKVIISYLKQFIDNLEGVCWDASFPLSNEEIVYAEAVTWNYLALGEGFFIAAENASKENDQLIALALALQAMGQAQLHIAAVYARPNEGFWSLVYKIFALAEKNNLLEAEINEVEIKQGNLKVLFKKIIIFQLCDNSQFRPRDMRTIFEFLDKVCNQCVICSSLETETKQGWFFFNLATDKAPLTVKKLTEPPPDSIRYFSSMPAAYTIYHTIKNANTWSGALKTINNSLFRRVVKTLGIEHKRKYTRLNDDHTVNGVIGFENIVRFLYHHSTSPVAIALQQIENATDFSYQELKLLLSRQQLETSITKEQENDVPAQAGHATTQEGITKPEPEVAINKMTIFDSSAKGYSVYWQDVTSKIRIGDIFGIIAEDQKRLEIAVIRRIAMSSRSSFRFGAEVIGFESETVYVSRLNNINEGVWGLFIPGIKQLKQADTLIYHTNSFNVGDKIYIHKGENERIDCLVVAEMYATSTISHVEIAYSSRS